VGPSGKGEAAEEDAGLPALQRPDGPPEATPTALMVTTLVSRRETQKVNRVVSYTTDMSV